MDREGQYVRGLLWTWMGGVEGVEGSWCGGGASGDDRPPRIGIEENGIVGY